MISVGVPAFDKKANKMNETKKARLLGVAGTDVPVEDINKLTLPYKLGVNGYSFIVSNNGYVLLHPDLKPVVINSDVNLHLAIFIISLFCDLVQQKIENKLQQHRFYGSGAV